MKLVLAMEAEEIVEASDEVVPAVQAEAEVGANEVAEDAGEIEEMTTAVEEAMNDVNTMDEIKDVMEDSVEAGTGVSPETAEIAEIAIEHIRNRLGIRGQSPIPAMESFGGANSRLAATRIACEGIVDDIKRAWEAIKKFFISIYKKVRDFFAKFFDNTDKVKKYAEALRKQASELGSAVVTTKEFESSSIAGAFVEEGKSGLGVVKTILNNHKGLTEFATGMSGVMMAGVSLANNAIKDIEKADLAEMGAALDKLAETTAVTSKTSKPKTTKSGTTQVKTIGPFVRNNNIAITVSSDPKKPSIKVTMEAGKEVSSDKLETLDQKQIQDLCEQVSGLMDKTEEFKKEQGKIDGMYESFVKLTDAAIGFADKLADGAKDNSAVKEKINGVRTFITDMNAFMTRFITMTPAINVHASKVALAYCKASLGNHGTKEAKK